MNIDSTEQTRRLKSFSGNSLAAQCCTTTRAALGSSATTEPGLCKGIVKEVVGTDKNISLNSVQEIPGRLYL